MDLSELKKIPVILDGDPGHDDAIAWMLTKASPVFDILAVTSCNGNQTIEKTTNNALRVCTLLGIDAPVARGLDRGLLTDPIPAGNIHGQTGLDGPALPEPGMELSDLGAVRLMAKHCRRAKSRSPSFPPALRPMWPPCCWPTPSSRARSPAFP